MSRVSPLRLCTVAGLAAGTVAAGVALAPTALAAGLPAPTAPATVEAGVGFQVTGTGCVIEEPFNWAVVGIVTDVPTQDPEDDLFGAIPHDDGSWTATVVFPAGTTGRHEIRAACGSYYGEEATEYPVVTVTVGTPSTGTPSTPTASTTSAAPTTSATGQIRGTSANSPGVASPDTGAATGDRSTPGQKVVKVLTGFKPGEVVTVTLHSTPQRVASATADASGTVRIEFTLPAGTPAGAHTLVYEGSQGTYFQEAFTVTAAAGSGAALAYTGASVALPLGLGAGALALGGGLVVLSRRRSAGAPQA
ncbi:hypothetical protein GCM10027451_44970 [Geodermatophilus aquaeductus]|uniref:LPXTG-motif cell wall anchor domain-containing protein n=1 Tax=Geodermatophilus aquaeductus TaxID=1564161 RepID=A0A521EEG3_9ACTN|nr:hypothetical protein [Geodermatophilus aquaeductus]SMO82285.1 hypothetical protein SAMN06273567_10527 [Geodermatophilus aquaeductus]